ncbi:MAG: hypothetical protein JSU63_05345 [Phycisphaerales bacterium]|nr:MAG: hypothetical protein JSU63_05345 [Phycisphaerales bacterium]
MTLRRFRLASVNGCVCAALLLPVLTVGCSPAPPAETPSVFGSGVDENADQGEAAQVLVDELTELVPSDDAKISGAVQLQTGPEGAVAGIGLEDGTRIFALGQTAAEGAVELTGAVLEDEDGNLIMMQENLEDAIKITHATGDAFLLENTDSGHRLTVTLNATVPESTLVIDIDADGVPTLNEDESTINGTENSEYNVSRITLPRSSESMKLRLDLQRALSDDCPTVEAIGNTISQACLLWGLISGGLAEEGLDRTCLVQQALLDGLRGSDPIVAGQGPELAPKLIAGLKLGQELTCQVIKNGLSVASIIKSLSYPDLACLAYSIADDGARLLTEDARNLTQVICDSLSEPVIGIGCSNTCVGADNGRCEDGGTLSVAAICLPATDCNDCGARDVPGCSNTCATALNNICEEGISCDTGTDCHDCGGATPVPGCSDRCDSSQDGECDDGGSGSMTDGCAFGTDCTDCGPRDPEDEPEVEDEDCSDEGICNANCPTFEPDINCTNADLCAAKGFCCEGDEICDIQSCNERDGDCTNADYCSRRSYCCDDDDICDDERVDADCPTHDADCAYCGIPDDVCIYACEPDDPDCEPDDEPDDAEGGCCYNDTLACIGPVNADDCTAQGGEPQDSCDPDPCTFACCFPEGICAEDRSVDDCIAEGGTVNSRGSTCDSIECGEDEFPKVFTGTGTRTLYAEGGFPGDSATNVQSIDVEIVLYESGVVDGAITTPDGEVVEVPIIGGGTTTQILNNQSVETTCPADASNNAGETVTIILYTFGSVGVKWDGNWSTDGSYEMDFPSTYMPAIISGTFSDTSISGSGEWPDPQDFPDGRESANFICSSSETTVYSRLEWQFSAQHE